MVYSTQREIHALIIADDSFGNAVELIVAIAALAQSEYQSALNERGNTDFWTDELRLVQTSLLGSVLSNLLLVLGMSFFA